MSRDISDMIFLKSSESEFFSQDVAELFFQRYGQKPEIGHIEIGYFNNNEIDIQLKDSVRKKAVIIYHHFFGYDGATYDPNIGFMKLYLIDDAIRNSSADEITYILPHVPYQRQDRIEKPRKSISARRTIRMLKEPESTVPTRIVTFDMHAGQIQGFVNYPIDNLMAFPLFLDYFRKTGENYAVVAPDAGGLARAKKLADSLEGSKLVVVGKTRAEAGKVAQIYIIGEELVDGRDVIIVDDLADTGRTLIASAERLKKAGGKNIYACCTHPLLSSEINRKTGEIIWKPEKEFRDSGVKVISTDTIPKTDEYLKKNEDWFTQLSVKPIVAEAINEIQTGGSISKLFK